jgi:hypothetical protein
MSRRSEQQWRRFLQGYRAAVLAEYLNPARKECPRPEVLETENAALQPWRGRSSLIGWAAASGFKTSSRAWILHGLLFLWQIS